MSRNSAGSSSQAHFAKIPSANIQRSAFNRDFTHKTTFSAGKLIPIFCEEILPGDTVNISTNVLARLATPKFPYMDNVFMDVHYFFVPNRLVWDNWERFNGAQTDPGDSTDYIVPQIKADLVAWPNGFGELTTFDYFGIPTKVAESRQSEMPISLPFRAYNAIWNAWYRDENLQASADVDRGDGPDNGVLYAATLPRNRRKDYFTSALPWPQKGPAVLLPLGGAAEVIAPAAIPVSSTGQKVRLNTLSGSPSDYDWNVANDSLKTMYANTGIGGTIPANVTFGAQTGLEIDQIDFNNTAIFADLTTATAATINELRQAFQVQRLYERDARGGTRYTEILLSHFGVVSPDSRLQRPEFLGGGTFSLNVNPIAQTSETADSPQGNLAAFVTASGSRGFSHSFVEHGYVIGLISARADTTYQQGMNKMWTRRTRFDFYWPAFAHLGEQPIFNKELVYRGSAATSPTDNDNTVYGYQERFAEYRFKPSMVTGRFRSNATQSLDAWHLALDLNEADSSTWNLQSMIVENPPINRVIAVTSEPQFILDTFTKFRHVRPMPAYSVPGLIDHF